MNAIDLSQLSPPDVVETISFENVLAAWRTDFLDSLPAEERAAFEVTLSLESEPLTKLMQTAAYREVILRQRINDAAKATMLAYSSGNDLDHWGVGRNLPRFTDESDADYRRRLQLSLEGITTAGSTGSYIFHALSADPDVKDASVFSPSDGVVLVTVLTRSGTGFASPAVIAAVELQLNDEFVRPLTDDVQVQSAEIVNFIIESTLHVRSGPDSSVIRQAAIASVQQYIEERRQLGAIVSVSGIYAALQRPGVEYVDLAAPVSDIVTTKQQAPYCTGFTVSAEVYQ